MANKYRAWVDGEILTATNLIDYVQKNVVIPCDSSTDYPDSSVRREGMTIWDKNLDKLLTYTTSTTGWVPPWNMPWGTVYATTASTNVSLSTNSEADLTGLTAITWTAVANRRYRTTVVVPIWQQISSASQTALKITDSSNVQKGGANLYMSTADKDYNLTAVAYETGLSGSVTRKARAITVSGTATIAASSVAMIAIVEDIGPSGSPA